MIAGTSNRKPLAPILYVRRNLSRVAPLVAVIVLAVMLISAIIAMINSIPLSIKRIYAYSRHYAGVSPRGNPLLTPIWRERILQNSPIKVGRVITCRASENQVRSIVGKWPFVVLALSPDDMDYYLHRLGSRRVAGRIPFDGRPEAIVSEPVARNLGKKLGDALLSKDWEDAFSPNQVNITGIADTDEWLMLMPLAYHKKYHFPPIDVLLFFAEKQSEQRALDKWIFESLKGENARVWTYERLESTTNEMFNILYKILNVIIFTLVAVITLMMAMLINIFQSQRIQEFGLLQALGYSKSSLVRRVLLEITTVVVSGWVLGIVAAYLMLLTVETQLMYPQAFYLDKLDLAAYRYTILVPIAILLAAIFTVLRNLRKFDPVGVLERRTV